jgi:predicted Rossmann-fold nucleotide-binding protein
MVPMDRRTEYLDSTIFGVYGSNLVAGDFEAELRRLMEGVLRLKANCTHPLLNADKPLCLVTGGGPGAMEVGNRVAKSLGILSCGLFVDFGSLARKPGATINEQKKNPYVEAYMTYRPSKLVERQSDFNLDFPIFLTGGIGTDFEYALEEVRRKVGTARIHPMLLFGTPEHWGGKITGRYLENLRGGTIKGSEWISTVPWVVGNGHEALAVLTRFFCGTLPIGPGHPSNERGFMVADEAFMAQTASLQAAM